MKLIRISALLLFMSAAFAGIAHDARCEADLGDLATGARVFIPDDLTEEQRQQLISEIDTWGLYHARFGKYLIIGGGLSFAIMEHIFREMEATQNPEARTLFFDLADFAAKTKLPYTTHYDLRAAAFFNGSAVAFSIPHLARVPIFIHETSHANLEASLQAMAEHDGWARPYAVFGRSDTSPKCFKDCLSEIDAFRSELLFQRPEHSVDDDKILDLIEKRYMELYGFELISDFIKVWPVSRLAGHSIEWLIRNEITQLNRLELDGVLKLGRSGIESQSVEDQENFLRLIQARYIDEKSTPIPEEALILIRALLALGGNPAIQRKAEFILHIQDIRDGSSKYHNVDEWDEYQIAAKNWGNELAKAYSFNPIPLQVLERLFYAEQHGILTASEATERYRRAYGNASTLSKTTSNVLLDVFRTRGTTVGEKLRSYLERLNSRSFSEMWDEVLETGDDVLRNYIIRARIEEIRPLDVIQLLRRLSSDRRDVQRSHRALFRDLLDHFGFRISGRLAVPGSGKIVSREVDEAFAELFLDGKNPRLQMETIIEVIGRIRPEELPRFHSKLLSVARGELGNLWDRYQINRITLPNGKVLGGIRWGRSIVRAALESSNPHWAVLEYIGEFYSTYGAAALGGPRFLRPGDQLNRRTRLEIEKTFERFNAIERDFYNEAVEDLWILLGNPNERVRRSAEYALLSTPLYLLGIEERARTDIWMPESNRIESLLSIIRLTRPGFWSQGAEADFAPFREQTEPFYSKSLPEVSQLAFQAVSNPEPLKCHKVLRWVGMGGAEH